MLPLVASLALTAALSLPVVASAQAPAPPAVAARAWTLVDVTSGQRSRRTRPTSGATPRRSPKLMTAYLVFGALRQKSILPSQMVNVSERAWRAEGSRMFIEPRKSVSVDELVHGMIVQSGNDASIALAELVGGSEAAFVEQDERGGEAARHAQHAVQRTSPACPTRSTGRPRATSRSSRTR
jgi:D-alanyl-D-alanine carboxypeptidase (penicillin-binding protein 5/6)